MTTTTVGKPRLGAAPRKPINITIDTELLAHVDQLAQAYGISRSQVINELLAKALTQ